MIKKKKRFLFALIFLIGFAYLWSRSGIAQWYVASSDLAKGERDYPLAIQQINRAIRLQPNSPGLHASRAQLRLEMIILGKSSDFESCIADLTRSIELTPTQLGGHPFLSRRSEVYQHWANYVEDDQERTEKFRLAIEDSKSVVKIFSSPSHAQTYERASALNTLSYSRCLANIEIEQALVDIDEALAILDALLQKKRITPLSMRNLRSAWLDTRGYLRYQAGLYDEARSDMEEALRIQELQMDSTFALLGPGISVSVMYFHRGKIYEALKYRNLAELDLQLASQLGYPGNGAL